MKGCVDDNNPSHKLPMYKTPNPFGIIQKVPKKLIPMVMRLTHLDRIAMEVLLATITVPDKDLKRFVETKLTMLFQKVEKPIEEAMEKLGQKMIEPIFRALPFVNMTYILSDLSKASKASDDVKEKGAEALESVIDEARDLYEDIQGPSRTLSSLILGLSNYLKNADERQVILKEVGQDLGKSPKDEDVERATSRFVAAKLAKDVGDADAGDKKEVYARKGLIDFLKSVPTEKDAEEEVRLLDLLKKMEKKELEKELE